jgi:hypothetical protein
MRRFFVFDAVCCCIATNPDAGQEAEIREKNIWDFPYGDIGATADCASAPHSIPAWFRLRPA